MMQAVYQVALRHHMRERNETYGQWLYEALFRCHLSMTFAKESCPQMSGALFSGRRTGHHIFSLAQVLYHSRFYTGAEGGGKCIGTSSVDAWFVLSKVLGFPGIVPPAGTHAHELSMVCRLPSLHRQRTADSLQVLMSLLPALDQNEESIVVTQALGHWLCVLPRSPSAPASPLNLPPATTVSSTKASPSPCPCCPTPSAPTPS